MGGLPSLIESFRLAGRRRPLRVYALPETMAVARALMDTFAFELTMDRWSFEVSFTTVDEGAELTFLRRASAALPHESQHPFRRAAT